VIKTISDISKIPTSFDSETLLMSHRKAFENSNVKILKFLNIVYLVIRFLDGTGGSRPPRGGHINQKTK
jgi:hypothetical protein